MRLFEFLHKYFGFNKGERNGIILLTAIILVLVFIRIFIPSDSQTPEIQITKLEALRKKPVDKDKERQTNYSVKEKTESNQQNETEAALFPFDPNTVSIAEARQLGFTEKLAGTLDKFRSKGGSFKTKDDLRKLYGMKEELFAKLEPYVLIAPPQQKTLAYSKEPFTKKAPAIVDINTADSAQLVALPMIGPGFSRKILKFRNALGGFYKTEQLKEVYGMNDSTYAAIKDRIKVSIENIRKLNVNSSDVNELKKHPYISYAIASAIVNYRLKHGLYKEAKDLKATGTINDVLLEKLTPYVVF
jgi:DNA uptake protein ComE-like DNA-binding protein